MTHEHINIEQHNEFKYQVHNLPRSVAIWIQVENFDLQIKRTDEGIVVDIFDMDDEDRGESLASTYAFDTDTMSYQEGDDG